MTRLHAPGEKPEEDSPALRTSVGAFFDQISDDYGAAIQRCFPRYSEMLWALLAYLPNDWRPANVLELGSGTGNFSVMLANAYPDANYSFVDLSQESLDVLGQRLRPSVAHRLECRDFRELDFADGTFDWITSSIAIHHLRSEEKRTLFQQMRTWLRPGGILTFADQFRGATSDLNARHMEYWQRASRDAGASADEWAMWMAHQDAHDHHDSLEDQMNWLREAGFENVDCVWRYLLWTVLRADKGRQTV